jgi:hypothetical protein
MGEDMSVQHKELSDGRWGRLSVCEQMAHIGSEVSRALNWRKKGNGTLSRNAADRALELTDFSLDAVRTFPRRKEFCRMREALADFFYGENQYGFTELSWRNYFDHFNYAANLERDAACCSKKADVSRFS